MRKIDRTFASAPAVRASVPLILGLYGPSGSGKTRSALRLATGIQRVSPGQIFLIDTENRRGLHYADNFKYTHVPFEPPFSPLDYAAAIEHCVDKGAKTIIIDQLSSEHDGPGGVLEMHDDEVERLVTKSKFPTDPDKQNFPAWVKPKAERRRLIHTIGQAPCNFILLFRAKEKTKPKGGRLEELGFMPIAGDDFLFEMLAMALLLPNAQGVPTWQSTEIGEKTLVKLPDMFRQLSSLRGPLSEEMGEIFARWCAGGAAETAVTFAKNYQTWGGRSVGDAPLDEIKKYMDMLSAVLNDPSKAKAHGQTRKHLDQVDSVYRAMRAALSTSADVPGALGTESDFSEAEQAEISALLRAEEQ